MKRIRHQRWFQLLTRTRGLSRVFDWYFRRQRRRANWKARVSAAWSALDALEDERDLVLGHLAASMHDHRSMVWHGLNEELLNRKTELCHIDRLTAEELAELGVINRMLDQDLPTGRDE